MSTMRTTDATQPSPGLAGPPGVTTGGAAGVPGLEAMLAARAASPADALRIFDALPPVTLDFMVGRWRGYEITTGHPMEGLLEPSGWYGKLFVDRDAVHPLLFHTRDRRGLYAVDPKWLPVGVPIPRSVPVGLVMRLARPLVQTRRPKARMRMVEYRGKVTGTMAYDEKPICDHFVAIDDARMLGVMDLKGVAAPYVFVLERDASPTTLHLEGTCSADATR